MDPSLWDTSVKLQQVESDDMGKWTESALTNPWVSCRDSRPASKVLVTDASDWGWGAIFFDVESGTISTCSIPWSEEERVCLATEHSVYSEPEAVYRALCRFVRPSEAHSIAVLSDSTTAVYALSRGYSPSFMVNAIANRCRRGFPNVRLDFHHVAGHLNAGDSLSRGLTPPSYQETVAAVRRMMGTVKGLNVVGGEPSQMAVMGHHWFPSKSAQRAREGT
jgi:hypothetical protein